MDETHLAVNMDDRATREARGAAVVKHPDVVSAGEGMTLVVTNGKRRYPIRDLADDVPNVSYLTGPKG
ncbi:hypothetical protein PybrP1_011611 [[Pythium] brassicae (nom. inval.)]|nr:hypothetical protein PybrP1_011611 [[Pythium] brassicae (nom. inval.)]